jgi:hypothetical protein
MKREDVHIKFSAVHDAECDNCDKRTKMLHEIKTPHWTKYFCDKCGSWFIDKGMEAKKSEVVVQGRLDDGEQT